MKVQMASLVSTAGKLCLVAFLAWSFQACGGGAGTQQDAVDSAKEVNDTTAAVDQESADFAVKAADAGMTEVQLGDAAQQLAGGSRIKDFGNMMVRDHSKANDELKTLAATKNITLPDSVGEEHKKHIDDLKKKKGVDFDKAYIDMMVNGHKDVADMFEKAADNLKDADLKAFAARTLPIIRAHLDSAQTIQATMKKQMNNSNRPQALGK